MTVKLEKKDNLIKILKISLMCFIILIISIFLSVCTDIYSNLIEMNISLEEMINKNIMFEALSIKKIALFSVVYLVIFESLYFVKLKTNNVIETLFKYRYQIAIVILLICLVFQISGSSIGLYKERFRLNSDVETGEILGKRKNYKT